MTAFRRQGISWLTAALLGIRCRTHHWRRLETCSAWQYWAAYFQGGSKVILTPAVAACQQQRDANDRWAQIKLQSCGCGRSATATQRVLCVIVHDIHDDAELCCAAQDNGNANFCCSSASSSAQRRRQDSLRSKAAQLSRRKNVHAASRVGSVRTRAVEAAIDGS